MFLLTYDMTNTTINHLIPPLFDSTGKSAVCMLSECHRWYRESNKMTRDNIYSAASRPTGAKIK